MDESTSNRKLALAHSPERTGRQRAQASKQVDPVAVCITRSLSGSVVVVVDVQARSSFDRARAHRSNSKRSLARSLVVSFGARLNRLSCELTQQALAYLRRIRERDISSYLRRATVQWPIDPRQSGRAFSCGFSRRHNRPSRAEDSKSKRIYSERAFY